MKISIGNSCGSCNHSNKPKKPRDHAAHYEVAKTERWCYKHNCNVTRECTCNDYNGINRSAKTSFTRINNFNKRLKLIYDIINLIGDEQINIGHNVIYKKHNNWLCYCYNSWSDNNPWKVSSKTSSNDNDLNNLFNILKND